MFKKEFFLVSTMEKVLPTTRPTPMQPGTKISSWPGARAGVQLVYYMTSGYLSSNDVFHEAFSVAVEGGPCEAEIRKTQLVPVEVPCQPGADDYFISKEPGMYPDLLLPLQDKLVPFVWNQYRSLWISFDIPEDAKPGEYTIKIKVTNPDGVLNMLSGVFEPRTPEQVDDRELTFTLSVGKAALPESRVSRLHFFHPDCLIDYYKVEAWSEEHWRIVENFIRFAMEHNCHEINIPALTLALDVAKTADRTTSQLVDVYLDNGEFTFGWDKVKRWCKMCKELGVQKQTVNPLFSQWGATHTIKVDAIVDGVKKKLFGWHVPVTEPLYQKFLNGFIPGLRQAMAECGYGDDRQIWTISDEPMPDQVDAYERAYNMIKDLIKGVPIIDSLNSVEFYRRGIADSPDVPLDYVDEFIEAGVDRLVAYFCVAQVKDVPNNFICMPNNRCRILGVLFYVYDQLFRMEHWGYNFYNTRYSYMHINPFNSINADWCFPIADSYLVYPGDGGEVWSSIRNEILDDVFYDLRSLQLLESLTSREYVLSLIYEHAGMDKMTMFKYPRSDKYLIDLRERVAAEIDARL